MAGETHNEEIVRRFFEEALNTGDLEKMRPYFHPDAQWIPMAKSSIPGTGVHRGRKGIVDEFLGPVRGLFIPGDPKNEITNLFGRGPWVAVETHGTGTFRNGKPYDNRYGWMVEIKDDMILTIREYMDTAYIRSITGSESDNKKAALDYFNCILGGDIDGAMNMLAADATLWLPDRGTLDKAAAREFFAVATSSFKAKPVFTAVGSIAEGSRVAVECTLAADLKNGRHYENRYHVLFEFEGGKIKSVKEYTDSAPAKAAFGA